MSCTREYYLFALIPTSGPREMDCVIHLYGNEDGPEFVDYVNSDGGHAEGKKMQDEDFSDWARKTGRPLIPISESQYTALVHLWRSNK